MENMVSIIDELKEMLFENKKNIRYKKYEINLLKRKIINIENYLDRCKNKTEKQKGV